MLLPSLLTLAETAAIRRRLEKELIDDRVTMYVMDIRAHAPVLGLREHRLALLVV